MVFMNNCENRDKCLKYAQAYIIPQKFENLYSLKDALYKGTIFKDLYRPYKEDNSVNKCR